MAVCFIFIFSPLIVSAAQVTLQWDPNDSSPEGYKLFRRQTGESYNYNAPTWTGTQTSCTFDDLQDGVTYFFIVRAYEGDVQSADSNEVSYTSAALPPNEADSDNDGVTDALDAFPLDPSEWKDRDNDGIGDFADTDDDNDWLPDSWELQYGLNPSIDDASSDLDGDGVSNLTEFQNGTDPSTNPDNMAPYKPVLSGPSNGSVVDLLPILVTEEFVDGDGDSHARTRYQISTFQDFSLLTFEVVSGQHLTNYPVQELVLDPDTVYYWRACFYDDRNGRSEWSDIHSFTTHDYYQAGDSDANGILDHQEIDAESDLDEDGNPDANQANMLCVMTNDPINPRIGIKSTDDRVQVVAVQALDQNGLSLHTNKPDQITGLVSFKLYLDSGVTTATIKVFLSEPAPDNARWYKYDPEQGWFVYPDAVLSEDRKSITLVLEDGGYGDQDGVQNGVIVDPSGLGYNRQTDSNLYSDDGASAEGGCFIDSSRCTRINGRTQATIFLAFLFAGIVWMVCKKVCEVSIRIDDRKIGPPLK